MCRLGMMICEESLSFSEHRHLGSSNIMLDFHANYMVHGNKCTAHSPLGYSGQKCDQQAGTTVAPFKCSDCVTAGTQYCTSNNGIVQCVCKTGAYLKSSIFGGLTQPCLIPHS